MVADNFDEVVDRGESVPELEVAPQDLYHAKSFWTRWIFSQDAKVIGIQYSMTAIAIGLVAMVLSWLLGGVLLSHLGPSLVVLSWLHVKLVSTIFLTVIHMMMARWRKDFEADRNTRSDKFYRAANEIPTFLMFVIIIMVIVRPF